MCMACVKRYVSDLKDLSIVISACTRQSIYEERFAHLCRAARGACLSLHRMLVVPEQAGKARDRCQNLGDRFFTVIANTVCPARIAASV